MKRKFTITGIITLFVFLLFSFNGFANKTSVKIIAPEKADKGTEITIQIEVSHKGNSSGHHTDWVLVKINGEEFKKWEYAKDKLPKDQNFVIEFKVKAEANMEIVATGHCNRHGSKNEEKTSIIVK